MNFVSPAFLVFLSAVFLLYWHLDRRRQNLFLVLASYFFYANWDWRFLSLIMISTGVDFLAGPRIHRAGTRAGKRGWLLLSLLVNLGILGYFKYFNFFTDSFIDLAQSVGWYVSYSTAHIVLPVGISFYTFQTLSYTIDIYRGELKPTRSLVEFAAFVAFFPQLVAGPIVRAKEFLYQLEADRELRGSDLEAGLTRFLLGFFKKAFVADTLAIYLVDPVFAAPESHSAGALWLALLGYTVQVYADFSGYSSMAIGSARILGFRIPENFFFPYLARNFSQVWRRWHATMSNFFRDYVYIPLGGNRRGLWTTVRNLAATTLVSGLWHGAAWTFVVFGALHGVYIGTYQVWRHLKETRGLGAGKPSTLGLLGAWGLTQFCWAVALVLFRSETIGVAWTYARGMVSGAGEGVGTLPILVWIALSAVVVDHLAGWLMQRKPQVLERIPTPVRAMAAAAMIVFLYSAVPREANPFIYFQF